MWVTWGPAGAWRQMQGGAGPPRMQCWVGKRLRTLVASLSVLPGLDGLS